MKYLALDIGGVCITINQPKFLRAIHHAQDTAIPEAIQQDIAAFECGEISENEFGIRCADHLKFREGPQAFLEAWNVCLDEPIQGIYPLMEEAIKKGLTPVFFSDTSSLHLRYIRKHYPIAQLVAHGIYSHEVGARKPSSGMYQAFEAQYGRPLLYIDDREQNIMGAAAFSWPAYHFQAANELAELLRQLY